jgi:hypothetical protein
MLIFHREITIANPQCNRQDLEVKSYGRLAHKDTTDVYIFLT